MESTRTEELASVPSKKRRAEVGDRCTESIPSWRPSGSRGGPSGGWSNPRAVLRHPVCRRAQDQLPHEPHNNTRMGGLTRLRLPEWSHAPPPAVLPTTSGLTEKRNTPCAARTNGHTHPCEEFFPAHDVQQSAPSLLASFPSPAPLSLLSCGGRECGRPTIAGRLHAAARLSAHAWLAAMKVVAAHRRRAHGREGLGDGQRGDSDECAAHGSFVPRMASFRNVPPPFHSGPTNTNLPVPG